MIGCGLREVCGSKEWMAKWRENKCVKGEQRREKRRQGKEKGGEEDKNQSRGQ